MRATYLVEKINFQKKFAELGFLFNKLKVSSLSQILFHEVLSRGVVSLRKIRSWQNTLVLFDCLFCRLPCTTWVPRMATTLTRIRGGEKSKRSQRWTWQFWQLLTCSLPEYAGWEDGDGPDGPDVPLPLPLLLPHLQHGLLAQLPLDIPVIGGERCLGWDPIQSFWSADLAHLFFPIQKNSRDDNLRNQSNVKLM